MAMNGAANGAVTGGVRTVLRLEGLLVLGSAESPEEESFSDGLLEYPQYTRPRELNGMEVPDVLLSGDHAKIKAWRRIESLRATKRHRPDLLASAELTDKEKRLLEEL